MIRGVKQLCVASVFSAVLAGQTAKPMTQDSDLWFAPPVVQLIWSPDRDDFEHRQHVYLQYWHGHGLADFDFHFMTARGWNVMKSLTEDAVAFLQVSDRTTVEEVQEAIRQIVEKGGYRTVVITVGQ